MTNSEKREQLLYRIMQVPGTINNHYSREAETVNGALLQTTRYFKEFEKRGLIRRAVYDFEPSNKRREVEYYITYKGAKSIGMEDEYKYKNFKASSNIRHDSIVKDIALSFLYCFPEWECRFEYEPVIKGRKPDIMVKMIREGQQQRKIWVEVERKRECYKAVMPKIDIFEKCKPHDVKDVKCLFVLATTDYDNYMRHQEYERIVRTPNKNLISYELFIKKQIEDNNRQFNRFISAKNNIPNDCFFLNIVNYYNLKTVFDHKGQPQKFI